MATDYRKMQRDELEEWRAQLAEQHRFVRRLHRTMHLAAAIHTAMTAWGAHEATSDDGGAFWLAFTLINAALVVKTVRDDTRRWAEWQEMHAKAEREIARREAEL